MYRFFSWVGVLAALLLLPTSVFAQASITGVVRDASGAVLPGVTVEAASPVLIEKVRTAVTDGTGRYQIVNLRPGAYRVTFTLTGFTTVVRDGITLVGASTSAVNAPTCASRKASSISRPAARSDWSTASSRSTP